MAVRSTDPNYAKLLLRVHKDINKALKTYCIQNEVEISATAEKALQLFLKNQGVEVELPKDE